MSTYAYLAFFLAGIVLDAWAYQRGIKRGYYLALDHVENEAWHDRKGGLLARDPPRTTDEIVQKLRNEPW